MRLLFTLLLPGLAAAAVFPDNFGQAKRGAVSKPALTDQSMWDEYGLKDSEQAAYDGFTATAWRFQDSTGAMAAYQWLRPRDARPAGAGKLAAALPNGLLIAHGNYLFRFDGYVPKDEELASLYQTLPNFHSPPLPALAGYLPEDGLEPNSERYITGPSALASFYPRIPPSVAAFHLGTEALVGTYRNGTRMAVFSFPTPQIAQQRIGEFQQIPDALAKRSGPLIAVIVSPADRNEAERLLSKVRYQAEITWSEHVPTRRDNIGDLVINAFILIGLLLIFATVAGLGVGGVRAFLRTRRGGKEAEAMITLHLADR